MTRHRLLVVGHGMVAHRLLAELDALGLDGLEATVLGAEAHHAYNRILLPEVVAGRADLSGLTFPRAGGVRLLTSRAAARIDRARRVVLDFGGSEHPYDTLVLATGADPVFPKIDGLEGPDGAPLPGVTALRTWEDACRVREAAASGARVVVLGGGLLGVEAAVAVAHAHPAARPVVVHRGRTPIDRQFDPDSGRVIAASLADRGIEALTDVRIARVERRGDGALAGLRLTDDRRIPADLLVVAIGIAPRARLAAAADLWVRQGILVNADCRTDDPAIHAIGDCAQTGHGVQGLVGPGWEQARVVAHSLAAKVTGRPRPRPTVGDDGGVVRLKADGIDAVTMGEFPADEWAPGAPRVLSLVDPAGRRRVRIAVADGVLVGATCVGDAQVAADLTVAFDARAGVPVDPAALLARPLAGAAPAASVTELPDSAVVCRCNAVPRKQIADAVAAGADSAEAVAHATRATTGCGSCTASVCALVDALRAQPNASHPGSAVA